MASWEDVSESAEAPQPANWDTVSAPVEVPKLPDTTGVQKMAQENLAANDSASTPMQRTEQAAGLPVSSIIGGTAQPTDINAANRTQYVKAIENGSAVSGPDWMQTMLHAVAPIVLGGVQRSLHPLDFAQEAGNDVLQGFKGGAGLLVYPFLSDASKAELLKNNQLTDYQDVENPTLQEEHRRGLELEGATVGKAMGGIYAPMGVLSPIISPIIQSTGGAPLKPGELPTWRSNIPGDISAVMDAFGMKGMVHGAGELNAARTARNAAPQFASGSGTWNNRAGAEPILQAVADKHGIDVGEAPQLADQTIAEGAKNLFPAAKDFKDVSTVTGIPESGLKTVYMETGVHPDQIFEDAQHNPQIATDVAAGKVPEAYQYRIEPKPELAPDETVGMQVKQDPGTKSFSVVDKDGDHVSGGFDSAEEAQHFIEDESFKAQERTAIESEDVGQKQDVLTPESEQALQEPKPADNMYAGMQDKIESMTPEERDLRLDSFNKKMEAGIITAKEMGEREGISAMVQKPDGGLFSEANELLSIKQDGKVLKGDGALEYAHEIAKENGYLPQDEQNKTARPLTDLQDALTENGGRDVTRQKDENRVAKAKEALEARRNFDPAKIEHEAHSAGIDTDRLKGETDRQYKARLIKSLTEFYKGQEGSGPADAMRQAIGATIKAAEGFVGKVTGDFFDRLGDAYVKTFQPELVGPLAKRADSYMAKFKAKGQEAENAFYRQSAESKKSFDRLTPDERMEWLYDHETGRWNEEDDPDHARYQAIYDAMHEAEQKAIGAETAYKDNYLPHQWEDDVGVNKFFSSEAMIKKYGTDWFKKASEFKLIQEGVRAGFKLKTDNPESMLVARQLASDNMIRTMDLLKDMESSGIATKATSFSIDKKIAKTETAIADVQAKYKTQLEDIKKQAALVDEQNKPIGEPVSKGMKNVQDRLEKLSDRLDSFKKEKADNTLNADQMKELKDGFRIIGPDNKAWNIHQQAGPIWKNAIEMKGLWENQGATGDFYRTYMQGKAIWTQLKLGLSLFHPIHVAMIDLASDIAASADHLIQGGKLSDLATRARAPNFGLGKETLKGQDHPAVTAWNTIPEARTPEQQKMVTRMIEGGFKPTMSARDTVHFKENFDKAIAGVGLNNLRLIGTAVALPGLVMKPFFEHWIPGMKSEIYLKRYQDALDRDPTLETDAGRRGEIARQIAKDTDRTYGEMNNDVQFWNRNLRDSFNAAFISGGWKLAQIYNARGLLTPAKIAYKFAKTGEFSKADITYNMLHAYAYTGLTLALGGAINTMLGNPIGTAKDTVWDIVKNLVAPQTGEKNPDGTPIRLNQPAFAKEAYNLAHEINTKGIIGGVGSFLYHQTLLPGIVDTLSNRDFTGREIISNPTDLHQWMNAGWDSIAPISLSNSEKAEAKHSQVGKIAGDLGFPIAGAYLNQTTFEQKIIAKYDEQNPPKGDVYSAKLKAQMKQAYIGNDQSAVDKLSEKMKTEGMTSREISNAKKVYTKPFAEEAWKKLSVEDQRQIIGAASPEERQKFKLKSSGNDEE